MPKLSEIKISRYYNKIVVLFIVLTVLLIAFIAYFAFSKTVIKVTAKPQNAEVSYNTALAKVDGQLVSTEITASKEITDLKSVKSVDAKASGTVIIYNNYTADQPLVATTRLLSTEGILFRTTEDTVVPKGKSVTVGVQADQPGISGNIPASKFEIVALWQGKKDKIYAESTAAMTGGVVDVKAVSTEDITAAENSLSTEIAATAYPELVQQITDTALTLDEASLLVTPLETKTNAEAGAEVESLEITMTAKVLGVAINKDKLLALSLEKIQNDLNTDLEITSTTEGELNYQLLEGYDLDAQQGTLQVGFTTPAELSPAASIFDKTKLMGKNKTDLISYLLDFPQIENVDVSFSPFWVTTVPYFADSIKIEIE